MIESKFQFSLISINKFKILWSKIWKIYDTQTSKVWFGQTKLVMKYESFSMSHIVRVINLFLLIHVSGQIVKFTKRFLTMFALEVRCSLDNRIQQFLIVSRIINRLLLSIQLLATWGIWNQVVINGHMVKIGVKKWCSSQKKNYCNVTLLMTMTKKSTGQKLPLFVEELDVAFGCGAAIAFCFGSCIIHRYLSALLSCLPAVDLFPPCCISWFPSPFPFPLKCQDNFL